MIVKDTGLCREPIEVRCADVCVRAAAPMVRAQLVPGQRVAEDEDDVQGEDGFLRDTPGFPES